MIKCKTRYIPNEYSYNMKIIAAFLFIINTVSATHIEWALQHGAYLHKHLEYRDKGMYATGPINKSEILASIPKSLEFKCQNCTNMEVVQAIEREIEEPESFWAPYIDSLPATCQNALCEPLNYSIFTVRGGLSHKSNVQGEKNPSLKVENGIQE